MTDKYIVSKSEIEAAFKTVSQCKTADYCEGFNDALKAVLDNAQVVNSAPFGYVDLEQAIRAFDYGYGAVYLFNPKELKAIEDYDPLYTTPQPAPDTVPREEYDKLLEAIKEIYYRNFTRITD